MNKSTPRPGRHGATRPPRPPLTLAPFPPSSSPPPTTAAIITHLLGVVLSDVGGGERHGDFGKCVVLGEEEGKVRSARCAGCADSRRLEWRHVVNWELIGGCMNEK